jgi:hypothetical protein
MLVYGTPYIESLITHHTTSNSCDDNLQESNCDTNYNDKINKIYVVTTKSKVMYERQVSKLPRKIPRASKKIKKERNYRMNVYNNRINILTYGTIEAS